MKILVFIQVDDNKINKMSLETLRCAQIISNEVSAVTFDESVANELTTYNLNEVIFAKNSVNWISNYGKLWNIMYIW